MSRRQDLKHSLKDTLELIEMLQMVVDSAVDRSEPVPAGGVKQTLKQCSSILRQSLRDYDSILAESPSKVVSSGRIRELDRILGEEALGEEAPSPVTHFSTTESNISQVEAETSSQQSEAVEAKSSVGARTIADRIRMVPRVREFGKS